MKQLINPEFSYPTLNPIFLDKSLLSHTTIGAKKEENQTVKPQTSQLLNADVKEDIKNGYLPDLGIICRELMQTFTASNSPYKAVQFLDVLNRFQLTSTGLSQVLNHSKTRHVLVRNAWMKVVLIHWSAGESTSIHGHPTGGCAFKVLKGRLMEKRYSTDENCELLAKSNYNQGAITYIDDSMALHAVENPYRNSALSLHVYTPGI